MQARNLRFVSGRQSPRASKWLFLLLCSALPLAAGCKGCNSGGNIGRPAPLSAEKLLEKMVTAYQEAKSYEDRGQVVVSYKSDGNEEKEEAPFEVKFARPNRLSLNVYHLDLTSDGKQLRALIADPPTADLDGQVVDRPAPAELSQVDLFVDEEMRLALMRGPCRQPVQLELLLAEKPLELFLSEKTSKKLLSEETFEDHICHRVEVTPEEGPFVLWIDRDDFTLRRLEYPVKQLEQEIKEMTRQNGGDSAKVKDVRLSADFRSARLDPKIDDKVFAFAMPAGGKLVPKFMRPPESLPSALFGKRPEKFWFTAPDGKQISQADLDGKIAVLMWFVGDEPSKIGLTQLDKARGEFESQEGITFHAVFADPQKSTSPEKLQELLDEWKITTPVVRDEQEFGNSVFQIPVAPTLVILDATGKVQIFEPRANPELARQLPTVLKRLLKGDDLAAELVGQAERRIAAYKRHLSIGGNNGGSTIIEIPETKIDPWQEPELFKLTKLWTCGEIEAPGNLLVVEDEGKQRILVNSGWRGVAELDAEGKVVARHELPKKAAASFLRSAVDREGKRYYLAGANLGKQIVVLDGDWKVLFSYPSEDDTRDPVRDTQLFDLDGDGKPEIYVGFWGSVGVQQLDLTGKRAWMNRLTPSVLSLTETPPNDVGFRKLLVTGERGTVLRLNQFGNHDPEIRVGEWAIHHLFASRFTGQRLTQYIGLSYLSEQKVQAVALDLKLQEQWSYPLPEGVFKNQIQYVTSAMLLDAEGWFADVPDGQWIFAGANGSVHLVGDEGNFNDFFNSGENLSGIAAARLNGTGVLLLSSDKGVTAWRVERSVGSQ